MLTSEDQGINSFTQCVMPDSSDRIRKSAMVAMNNMLLTLQSFDPETDPFKHPKMNVIFNNVSKFDQSDKELYLFGEFEGEGNN